MVGGTTGESVSMTDQERLSCVLEWINVAKTYPLNVYVNVQHESLYDAKRMAETMAKIDGVKGIFAMSPVYFKPSSIPELANAMAIVASGAPDLPFWYYHFPEKTGVNFNMY